MENLQTIVCPNCGAVTSSNKNCEYCGSILSRIASAFYDENNEKANINDLGFGKTAYASVKLCNAIEKNVVQCNKHNSEVACIFELDDALSRGLTIKLISSPGIPSKLIFEFDMKERFAHYKFRDFESSAIGELFNIQQIEETMLCSIQLDNEARTSAQLIDYILRECVPDYDNDTQISPHTYVTLDGVEYKIATAEQKTNIIISYNKYFSECYKKYGSRCHEVNSKLYWIVLGAAWGIPTFGLGAYFKNSSIDWFGDLEFIQMLVTLLPGFFIAIIAIMILDGIVSKPEYYKQNHWPKDFEEAKLKNLSWTQYYSDAFSEPNFKE